jgi:hypothetical protein
MIKWEQLDRVGEEWIRWEQQSQVGAAGSVGSSRIR